MGSRGFVVFFSFAHGWGFCLISLYFIYFCDRKGVYINQASAMSALHMSDTSPGLDRSHTAVRFSHLPKLAK